MRFFSALFLFFGTIANYTAFAQTNISGTVNVYTPVISYDTCNNNCFNVGSTSGFSVGDIALVIQMKGMQINETNTASFGNFISYDSTGFHERAVISSVSPTQICFTNDLAIKYKLSGKVQIVRIARYPIGANVVGAVLAQPWNGSTGGIIAIEVVGTLTLNANIDASSAGFKGGKSGGAITNACNAFTNITDYATDSLIWQYKSFKGEGVAGYVPNKWSSRGPQANGGGGGNDHNSGGGGGANFASGGLGGRNNEPGTFNCKGYQPGLGGIGLFGLAKTRLFLGGGGGSGHQNNAVNFQGGNGGGIVYIKANTIVGNNRWILANGDSSRMSGQDGGSGGGAGGNIKLDIANYTGLLNVAANGGRGSSTNNAASNRCFGPGGGGAGGSVFLKTATIPAGVTIQTLAGAPGVVFNSSNACNGSSNSATAGAVGYVSFSNDRLLNSLSGATNCMMRRSRYDFDVQQVATNQNALEFSMQDIEEKQDLIIERSNDGENFERIYQAKLDPQSAHRIEIKDSEPFIGKNYYRASLFQKENVLYQSEIIQIYNGLNWVNEDIAIYPNPSEAGGQLSIVFPSTNEALEINISDINGRFIASSKLSAEEQTSGNSSIYIPASAGSGMFILKIQSSKGEIFVKKIFLK